MGHIWNKISIICGTQKTHKHNKMNKPKNKMNKPKKKKERKKEKKNTHRETRVVATRGEGAEKMVK